MGPAYGTEPRSAVTCGQNNFNLYYVNRVLKEF